MGVEIRTLPLVKIAAGLPCARPENRPLGEDAPAVAVMTDFTEVPPVTVEAWFGLYQALDRMKAQGVRLLLVTDEHDDIGGVVTSYDLQSERPVRYAESTGTAYRDMTVGQIMTPIAETPAVDYAFVRQSLVRHVVNTFKELERPHMLVVEEGPERQRIRGLFSTAEIGRILGRKIFEPLKAHHSLAEMKRIFS